MAIATPAEEEQKKTCSSIQGGSRFASNPDIR